MFTVFGLYDKINKSYIEMFVCKSEIEARSLIDGMVNYSDSVVSRFPNDFRIDEIVSIDYTGVFNFPDSVDRDLFSFDLKDFIRKEKKDAV